MATNSNSKRSGEPGSKPDNPGQAEAAAQGGHGASDGLDLREQGGVREGARQLSDRRLFMQLLAFGDCADTGPLLRALDFADLDAVLYEDLNDPHGIGLLTLSEDPEFFTDSLRHLLNNRPFSLLPIKPEYSMFGRTYAMGYEPDLEEALITRPRRNLFNGDWPWAIWYPLRRKGSFARLPEEDQRRILKEHGSIGVAFGQADHAHDIRLACFGLDKNDNDFVIGLVGGDLHPLSSVVERMRSTEQTSQYLEKLGPFFIGRAIWQTGIGSREQTESRW